MEKDPEGFTVLLSGNLKSALCPSMEEGECWFLRGWRKSLLEAQRVERSPGSPNLREHALKCFHIMYQGPRFPPKGAQTLA